MNVALIAFIIEQVLPWVIRNLPAILAFIQQTHPVDHALIIQAVKKSNDQGPQFDWHSGP